MDVLALMDKGLVANQLVLTVGYDRENLDDPSRATRPKVPVTADRYGRKSPKHTVGTENFPYTSISICLKREFLRDTEFTRKLIIPSDRFSDMIPAGHIIKQHPEEAPLPPIHIISFISTD